VILYAFATWSLGSRRWTAPVFLALLALVVIRAWIASRVTEPLRVRVLTRALMVPFIFLMAANLTSHYNEYYGPYLAACSAVLSFALWNGGVRMRLFAGWNRMAVAAVLGLASVAVVALPLWGVYRSTAAGAVAAVVLVVATASLFNARVTRDGEWRAGSFLLAALSGLAIVAAQHADVITYWSAAR
jgi:hypothetical protein